MANEKWLIDANALMEHLKEEHDYLMCDPNVSSKIKWWEAVCFDRVRKTIEKAPTVDAVELPKGKPGDYLEWDNGTGFRQIYHIHAVMVYEDCMRYDIEICTPGVNHPAIVRIMSKEEAEKEWKERCAREKAQEEPTLTACRAKMDGDGNG